MNKVDLKKAGIEELRQALEEAETKEKTAQLRKKKTYEEKRNNTVVKLFAEAGELNQKLTTFKEKVQLAMEDQALNLAEYGQIRSNSKGGFSIRDAEDNLRIRRTRDTNPSWDERSNKGVALIKDFLHDTIKKKAEKEFNVIMSFLEKNKTGDLEYSKVMMLLNQEDNYNDPRWREGLRLLKESYKIVLKGFGYYFDSKNDQGNWEAVPLNFSSL